MNKKIVRDEIIMLRFTLCISHEMTWNVNSIQIKVHTNEYIWCLKTLYIDDFFVKDKFMLDV